MITSTRLIGVDFAHRIPHHRGKCASIHGHRYTIEVTVVSVAGTEELHSEGEQTAMIFDFGFLKQLMMDTIDRLVDHGMVLWEDDKLLPLLYPEVLTHKASEKYNSPLGGSYSYYRQGICKAGKLTVVDFVPTAENLAKWWFKLLQNKLPNGIQMVKVKAWETVNCFSEYSE